MSRRPQPLPLNDWWQDAGAVLKAERARPRHERRSTVGVADVLLAMAGHSDDQAKDVWPGARALATTMGCHRSTAKRRRARAEALELYEVERRPDPDNPRHHHTNLYRLRFPTGSDGDRLNTERELRRTRARAEHRRHVDPDPVAFVAAVLAGSPSGACPNPECGMQGGHHVEGCSQAPPPTEPRATGPP